MANYSDGSRVMDEHITADNVAGLSAEIDRLRGMLLAHDIDPDSEYIAKGGLRVNAPMAPGEPKF